MKIQLNILPVNKLLKTGIAALIVSGIFTAASCTKDFESLNTDPNAVTEELEKIDNNNVGIYIPQMEESIYHNYGNPTWMFQIQQNLNADIFSGYLMPPTPFAGGQNNSNYSLVAGWNSWPFSIAYGNIMQPWWRVKSSTKDKNFSMEFYGVANVLKVLGMHRVTDIYGPIPYLQYGTVNPAYDSQEEVYKMFFKELDEAETLITAAPKTSNIGTFDVMYAGDFKKWLKLTNTLRLRLALRIVKANPALAKSEAEKALSVPDGLLSGMDDIAQVNDPKINHPLATIANAWGDIRMGASIETYLVGYNDPRLSKHFKLASDPGFNTQYKGIRVGNKPAAKADYTGFSSLTITDKTPIVLMTVAEAYFLKAEAALRGYAKAGDTEANYIAGVQASFDQYGISGAAPAYLANSTSVPAGYTDPKNATNNSAALSSITIKWNASAGNEEKLERIITQKWLANYPEGQEAWSEFRRTGYPRLLPASNNFSGGTIDSQLGVRRLPFSIDEVNNNAAGVAKAVTLLGGPDNGGTRLWWDKATPNF